jgi:hypothetical protein
VIGECRGHAEGPVDRFDEVPFFAKNESFALRHREVLAPVRIGLWQLLGADNSSTIEV